jgi:Uma2 family endonuclease
MSMVSTLSPVRFTVREYYRLSESGLLEEAFGARRTELLQGRVVKVAPQGRPHVVALAGITRLLIEATTRADHVLVQSTLVLGTHDAPEPDFAVFDVPKETPVDRLPKPILVIEISDSTYKQDSRRKARIYARHGIEDYWIVNIPMRRVEVYRRPVSKSGQIAGWRYASKEWFEVGQSISMLMRPAVSFKVEDMLP